MSPTTRLDLTTLAARLAIGSAVVALLLLASLHVLSPEYSPAWRMVSEYANGGYAWVLSLTFVAYGLSSLFLAFAIRSVPARWQLKWPD